VNVKIPTFLLTIVGLLSATQGRGLEGVWRGSIVMSPAVMEADVTIELSQNAAGKTGGRLRFPTSGLEWYPLENFSLEGQELSFRVHDTGGVITSFRGSLSDEGKKISGEMIEGQNKLPFSLDRWANAPSDKALEVPKLSEGGEELRRMFNAEADRRRLLVLLSPASFTSKVMLSLIERYVLDRHADPDLRLYVLWEVSNRNLDASVELALQAVSGLAPDARVTQFWTSDPNIGARLRSSPEGRGADRGAEPCLVFSRGKRWDDSPPVPDLVRFGSARPKAVLSASERFNAVELAHGVENLLFTSERSADGSVAANGKGNDGIP
jgi:hypothetical protein